MITLAVLTGISAEQWGREGGRAIVTGLDVLAELRGRGPADTGTDKVSDPDGPQYSG